MGLRCLPLRELVVSVSGTGDQTIVPGVPGTVIRVYQLFVVIDADSLVTFKDGGATAISGAMDMLEAGSIVFDYNGEHPWLATTDGNDLVMNFSMASGAKGRVYYTQGSD